MAMTTQRLPYIDALKGVAIMLVTIGHSFIGSNPFPPNAPYNLMIFIYSVHMPLFLFISGYVFNFDKYSNRFSLFGKSRFASLIFPYTYLYISSIPIMFLLSGYLPGKYSVQAYTSDFLSLLPQYYAWLWFLPILFLTEIFYFILLSITRNHNILLLILVVGVGAISVYNRLPNDPPWFAMRLAGIALLFYYTGNITRGRLSFDFMQSLAIIGFCSSIFLVFGGLSFIGINNVIDNHNHLTWIKYSIIAVCGILSIYLSIKNIYEHGIKSNLLEFLGRNCIIIYLLQGWAVAFVGRVNGNLFPPIIDGKHVFAITCLILLFTIPCVFMINYFTRFKRIKGWSTTQVFRPYRR